MEPSGAQHKMKSDADLTFAVKTVTRWRHRISSVKMISKEYLAVWNVSHCLKLAMKPIGFSTEFVKKLQSSIFRSSVKYLLVLQSSGTSMAVLKLINEIILKKWGTDLIYIAHMPDNQIKSLI